MFTLPEKNLKIRKMSILVTITVGQSSMQFIPHLFSENNRILRKFSSFSSFNNFKRLNRLNVLD